MDNTELEFVKTFGLWQYDYILKLDYTYKEEPSYYHADKYSLKSIVTEEWKKDHDIKKSKVVCVKKISPYISNGLLISLIRISNKYALAKLHSCSIVQGTTEESIKTSILKDCIKFQYSIKDEVKELFNKYICN